MPKPAIEFRASDDVPWTPVVGNAKQREKILAQDETGLATRLLLFEPGCKTVGVVRHDGWRGLRRASPGALAQPNTAAMGREGARKLQGRRP